MLRAIRCDQPNFREVKFQQGFNVVVAERTKESTKKDSRNGLGKTTLIEIIHFCLGASTSQGKGLLREPLLGWTFSLELELRGQVYTIHRNTEKPGRIAIEGNWSNWPIQPRIDPITNQAYLLLKDWNTILGWLIFELPPSIANEKYSPNFRSLISYFIRRGRDAFTIPFEHHRKQLEWDKQVHNAFLLELGWEYAQKWQILKDRDKALKQLKEIARSGLMPNLLGTIGELETTKVHLEEQVTRAQEQLSNFKVHPQYREIEERANTLTVQIHELTNENILNRRMIEFYESSLFEEKPASQDLISDVYEEAGVVLPGMVVKRLEDVRAFHQRVTTNRRKFLESEIKRLRDDTIKREGQIRIFSDERASLLSILQTHGALEEYTRLQHRHLQIVSQLEEIKTRIENLKKFEQERSALKIDQERLVLQARTDYEERQSTRQQAISFFNANSEALYKAPGKLIIDVESTGFKFQVDIERSTSQGIEQMKVFCYDLMLAQLWSEKDVGPKFLIHDSTIFDGVDERQIAQALQLARQEAERLKFQYICCLNSDQVPWKDFEEEFDLNQYKRLELTDATEDGGLLGIRF